MKLRPFLQRIGTGPRGSKDLSREEAREATRLILSGEVHPVEFGAFCMALRVKGEADAELIGAVEALLESCTSGVWNTERLVTTASPLDGKDRLMVVAPAAALLAANLGARVLVISDREVPPKKAMTPSRVFEALGFPPASDFETAARELVTRGWSCLELGRAIPGLGRLKEWRGLLGKRPFLSTAEKLVNPARSPLMTGVLHGPVLRQMDNVLRALDYPKSLVVQGTQGSVDFKIKGPTNVCLIERDHETRTFLIDPARFGLDSPDEPPLEPPTPEGCAKWTRRALAGEIEAGRKAAVLEAGALVFLAGVAPALEEGIELARDRWAEASVSALACAAAR